MDRRLPPKLKLFCHKPVCVQEHESYYPTPPHSTPAVTDDERAVPVAVPVCVCWNMNIIIPPHPTPAVTDDERAVPVAVPVCVLEHERYYPTPPHPSSNWWWKTTACCRACVCTGTWTLLSHPTPPNPTPAVTDGERAVPVAVPVCVQEHERYYPTPPHPTPAVTDDERPLPLPVPVCVLEHERYYPTPPHPTPHHPSSNTNVPKSHCRKWSVYNVW